MAVQTRGIILRRRLNTVFKRMFYTSIVICTLLMEVESDNMEGCLDKLRSVASDSPYYTA